MQGVERGAAFGVVVRPGKGAERLGHGRRAGGGDAERGQGPVRRRPEQTGKAEGGVPPLARPHASGGEALEEFELRVSLRRRMGDVGDLQVLVEIDEATPGRHGIGEAAVSGRGLTRIGIPRETGDGARGGGATVLGAKALSPQASGEDRAGRALREARAARLVEGQCPARLAGQMPGRH